MSVAQSTLHCQSQLARRDAPAVAVNASSQPGIRAMTIGALFREHSQCVAIFLSRSGNATMADSK